MCPARHEACRRKTTKQAQHPVLKKLSVCLPASPCLTDGAPAHEQTEPAAAAVRDQEAPKEEAVLGPMGEYVSEGTVGGLEAGILMQSNHDKQDANCHHKQSNTSPS